MVWNGRFGSALRIDDRPCSGETSEKAKVLCHIRLVQMREVQQPNARHVYTPDWNEWEVARFYFFLSFDKLKHNSEAMPLTWGQLQSGWGGFGGFLKAICRSEYATKSGND